MNDERCRISVCIATYNGEKYIKEQLASILSQLGSDDEIVISDDNSTDRTVNIVKQFKDKRLKIYLNNNGKGYVSNFENALNKAIGYYIFLADQDDVWVENKVQYCLAQLENYDLVVSDAVVVDENKALISTSFFAMRKCYRSFLGNILKFGYLGCCMAFKRKILERALPFPSNHKLCTHDYWLFLVAKTYYKSKISDEKLIIYRRHGLNTSTGGFLNNTSIFFKAKYRIYLLFNLIKRISAR